jgi:hypothetical protein
VCGIDLLDINEKIGDAESNGNRNWLDQHIAPILAFQRADGQTFDDREQFLSKVAARPPSKTTIQSVDVMGNRAVVKCIVELNGNRYHNLRMFVKHKDVWKILGWANEIC